VLHEQNNAPHEAQQQQVAVFWVNFFLRDSCDVSTLNVEEEE
jgi:hypothetical protein